MVAIFYYIHGTKNNIKHYICKKYQTSLKSINKKHTLKPLFVVYIHIYICNKLTNNFNNIKITNDEAG